MEAEELSKIFYAEFAGFAKPDHSTNYTHCEECAEYDLLLQDVPRETLSTADIGTVCWGPVTFLTSEAMAYYLPRLMELAVLGVRNKEGDSFVCQFLVQIGTQNRDAEQFSLLNNRQKELVLRCLEFLSTHYSQEIRERCYDDDLTRSLAVWSV